MPCVTCVWAARGINVINRAQLTHTVGRFINSDWYTNSFTIVVTDNHYPTMYEAVRIYIFSYRVF